ncbi:YrdB family protein [Nonomuraea sp. NPDC050663]|uniref:YrdB family protein n=1 Tax=Nonomuraea sp. NPDC050663 TaxID=3364370 RepID=UPI003791D835
MTIFKGANLLLMFLLELGVLFAAGLWGFTLQAGWLVRIVAGLGAPGVFIAVWALFGAANGAKIPLTGLARLVLELVWFGGGAVLLYLATSAAPAAVFFGLWVLNGILRLVWKQV